MVTFGALGGGCSGEPWRVVLGHSRDFGEGELDFGELALQSRLCWGTAGVLGKGAALQLLMCTSIAGVNKRLLPPPDWDLLLVGAVEDSPEPLVGYS